MKILIAEDEKAMSDALAAVLKHFGYEVDAVYDGLAATEKGVIGQNVLVVNPKNKQEMNRIYVILTTQ